MKCNNCSTTDVKYFFCKNCYKNNLKNEKLNIIVNIDPSKNIEKGWKIKLSENGYKVYESLKDEPK